MQFFESYQYRISVGNHNISSDNLAPWNKMLAHGVGHVCHLQNSCSTQKFLSGTFLDQIMTSDNVPNSYKFKPSGTGNTSLNRGFTIIPIKAFPFCLTIENEVLFTLRRLIGDNCSRQEGKRQVLKIINTNFEMMFRNV